ncbi:hypothetical protein BDF22DRAFT_351358 [Syncephalis plumigaleata]|nr:hypothetical protein BDF22DRAFT_351358 [Syncephalis plumigaleata]
MYWHNNYNHTRHTTRNLEVMPVVGDLVLVQGRPNDYDGQRQVSIDSIESSKDPNMEVLHWLEVMQLEQDVYAIPPTIPSEVYKRQPAISQQVMNLAKRTGKVEGSSIDYVDMRNDSADKTDATTISTEHEPSTIAVKHSSEEGLRIAIQNYIETRVARMPTQPENSTSTVRFVPDFSFSLEQLNEFDVIRTIASNLVVSELVNTTADATSSDLSTLTAEESADEIIVKIKGALGSLIQMGQIYLEDLDQQIYGCIIPQGNLALLVRDYLRKATQKLKSAQFGIRIEYLLAQVKSTDNFHEVRKQAVLDALKYLQEQGEAYEPSPNIFKAI